MSGSATAPRPESERATSGREGTTIVGVDVGGTFTDLVAIRGPDFWIAKVPSTPDDPSRAVAEGLARLCALIGLPVSAVGTLLHGTTVATNSILERRGAVTALLTTLGFRDVLEIARQARPRLFDFDARRPEPLVPRSRRIEVTERMRADGTPITPLDRVGLIEVIKQLRARGVEAIALCFIHSYANPEHEEEAAKLIAEHWPEASVSLSSRIIPEYREFERTSTVVANAFVAPVMSRYLTAMRQRLDSAGMEAKLYVMQSSGGLMSVERAARIPVATLLSGVAAGGLGGVRIAHVAGRKSALTIDMGGTSCDLALGLEGRIRTHRQYEVAGLPIRLPALDVHTIGAGGGSIAYLDSGGALSVGPRSAGAQPGPACYGRGGMEPTVTDANLVLGRLPTSLLGGELALSVDFARAAIRRLAGSLGLSVEHTAAGIIRVINAGMIRQMRVITIERGIDPRDCALVAFGGGGPVHAGELAREMGIRDVLIPPAPGVTSALGLILAGHRQDGVQTILIETGQSEPARLACARRLEQVFSDLATQLIGEMPRGVDMRLATITREVEARYRRQGHELSIGVTADAINLAALDRLEEDFHRAHEKRFGFTARGEPILVVNALVNVALPGQHVPSRPVGSELAGKQEKSRQVWFDDRWWDTPVRDRWRLEPGRRYQGPIVVEQLDTTTIVPPASSLTLDDRGNLALEIEPRPR